MWTNTRYRMVYMNMGHNDMDYEDKTNRQLSSTFSSAGPERAHHARAAVARQPGPLIGVKRDGIK